MARIFSSFDEIKEELREQAPPIIYKYRTWSDEYHRSLLTEQSAWFGHPFDLNDPLDVRPETSFNEEEVFDERYRDKLRTQAKELFPNISEEARAVKVQEQWEIIKADPTLILKRYDERIKTRRNYDQVGVFSTATSELNEELWVKYAGNYSGYCIGFKTIEFCEQMKSGYGFVEYSDIPYEFSFIKERKPFEHLFLKKTSWAYENEFRFLTLGIGKVVDGEIYSERGQTFPVECVAEIIIGHNIPQVHEYEIMSVLERKYLDVPVFKTFVSEDNVLTKVRIK